MATCTSKKKGAPAPRSGLFARCWVVYITYDYVNLELLLCIMSPMHCQDLF